MGTHVREQESLISTTLPTIGRRAFLGGIGAAALTVGSPTGVSADSAAGKDETLVGQARQLDALLRLEEALWSEVERCNELRFTTTPAPPENLLNYKWNGRPLIFKSCTGFYHVVDSVEAHVRNLDTASWTIGEPRDAEVADALKAWREACTIASRQSGVKEAQERFDAMVEGREIDTIVGKMADCPATSLEGVRAKLWAIQRVHHFHGSFAEWAATWKDCGEGEVASRLVVSTLADMVRISGLGCSRPAQAGMTDFPLTTSLTAI